MDGDRIIIDEQIGAVVFRRSTRTRRMSIRVHPVRGVRVSVPWFAHESDGLRFFLSRRDWVLRTMARQQKKLAAAEDSGRAVAPLGDGSVIRTLLSEILFREGDRPAVETFPLETGERPWLSLDLPIQRKTVRFTAATDLQKALAEILRAEAKLLLPRKLQFFAARFGFEYARVAVKHNSSNWGSCSAKGNINLNLNLVRLPEPLCDYVLLHELCHLHDLNHGIRFHRELEKRVADDLARLSLLGEPVSTRLLADFRAHGGTLRIDEYLSRQVARYRLI